MDHLNTKPPLINLIQVGMYKLFLPSLGIASAYCVIWIGVCDRLDSSIKKEFIDAHYRLGGSIYEAYPIQRTGFV